MATEDITLIYFKMNLQFAVQFYDCDQDLQNFEVETIRNKTKIF